MTSKLRELHPRELKQPSDVIRVRKEKKIKKLSQNKFINFFLVFFGEGF